MRVTRNGVTAMNSSWCTRVHRGDVLELHVDGSGGSAVAGLRNCVAQHGGVSPRPVEGRRIEVPA